MKTFLASAFTSALLVGAMTTTVMAEEPLVLTENQMDTVTAGATVTFDFSNTSDISVTVSSATSFTFSSDDSSGG
jgi:hypothetical protein